MEPPVTETDRILLSELFEDEANVYAISIGIPQGNKLPDPVDACRLPDPVLETSFLSSSQSRVEVDI